MLPLSRRERQRARGPVATVANSIVSRSPLLLLGGIALTLTLVLLLTTHQEAPTAVQPSSAPNPSLVAPRLASSPPASVPEVVEHIDETKLLAVHGSPRASSESIKAALDPKEFSGPVRVHGQQQVRGGDVHVCDQVYYEISGHTNMAMPGRQMATGLHGLALPPHRVLQQNRSEADSIANNRYDDFQLCIPHHQHHHKVEVFLAVTAGDADMYLSAHIPRPRAERHTWNAARAGSDHISLKTNLWDWDQKSQFLFIGVRGQGRKSVYSLRVVVSAGVAMGERLRGSHTAMVNYS